MKLVILGFLIAISFIFILAGAISKDRINLVPGAMFLLITGMIMIQGTPIEYRSGTDYTYSQVNNSYEIDQEITTYKEYNPPNIDKKRFSEILGAGFVTIAMYYFLVSVGNINFRTSMTRNN